MWVSRAPLEVTSSGTNCHQSCQVENFSGVRRFFPASRVILVDRAAHFVDQEVREHEIRTSTSLIASRQDSRQVTPARPVELDDVEDCVVCIDEIPSESAFQSRSADRIMPNRWMGGLALILRTVRLCPPRDERIDHGQSRAGLSRHMLHRGRGIDDCRTNEFQDNGSEKTFRITSLSLIVLISSVDSINRASWRERGDIRFKVYQTDREIERN